ncbi:Na,H/K antiporter P-type ATPase, alpha subunit [Ancylostoma ceylanicum]|uniref:Sodium/potassium-transporting ATPase subunit alpha n=1 Tax=Ancylostoma ceylanicum TaxID=53326 RepID=A0A0D6M0V6_9BILA|nr:Na,H/K antiporter P-type ATPase, alpha subunit [Ancylostoma ceylanicum]
MKRLRAFFSKDKRKLEHLKKDIDIDDHKIPIEELFERLKTSPETGLSTDEAGERLRMYGPNALTPPYRTPTWIKFLQNLFGGFNMLLWAASFASLVGYFMEKKEFGDETKADNLYLAITLATVVTITGVFSFYQEAKSGNIMSTFANMIPTMAHVFRDGRITDVKVEDVVLGDIVEISGGDKVPADIRIISARGLKVDNSSLTGESEPQSRSADFTHNNPLESKNVAMFSTSVLEGSARGVVILTADNTVVGRIAALTAQVSSGPSPIAKEINHFIHIITFVALGVGVTFFVLAIIYGYTLIHALIYFMGIVVANVPEGIVATVTVCLTLTAVKMRRKHCLVKNLEAVETLVDVITHKLNMQLIFPGYKMCDGIIDEAEQCLPDGKLRGRITHRMEGTYKFLMRCAALCSRATFKNEDFSVPLPRREVSGDASETAILKYCELILGNGGTRKMRDKKLKVAEIPFNSTNKYQVSIHQNGDRFLLVMKGAPEKILKACSTILIEGEERGKDKKFEEEFKKAYERLGGFGERVLGFCDLELDPEKFPPNFVFDTEGPNFPLTNLRFLGFMAMIDPPRPGVPQAVQLCQSAGVKVVMVTGDHPITAKAIARQVHIISRKAKVTELLEDFEGVIPDFEPYGSGRLLPTKAIIIHGEQLKLLSTYTLQEIVSHYPQKLQIVEAFQHTNNVVAVTGDGVNDAPALRKADIGIAMGIAGTDVSKQAADMILLNDNFASIVTGVEEGRLIFDNLKKSIAYTLTSNIPEITPFMCYVIIGIPIPLSLVAILMIDLGTDLSFAARKGLEASCHSGYFFAVVVIQWSDALISKTRKNSIVMQGIENQVLNTSLVFTAAMAMFITVTPGVTEVLKLNGIRYAASLSSSFIDDG